MKTSLSLIAVIFISSFLSCQFSTSVKRDFQTGLKTQGNGLSCEEVYLSNGETRINRKSFTYGESLFINFNDIKGFITEKNAVYPGMEFIIQDMLGDTIMYIPDLYENQINGFEINPLLLQSNVALASPVHSKKEYNILTKIWDKKGKGTYKAEIQIAVSPDENIKVDNINIEYDEIYLFSSESNMVLTKGKVKAEENVYFIFEGLDGFQSISGKSRIQLNMTAKDSKGNIIVSTSGVYPIDSEELRTQFTPYFKLPDSKDNNPIHCEIIISDVEGKGKITASTNLEVI